MMQGCFAILLFCLLAGSSFATECFPHKKLNTSLLSGGFSSFCDKYPVPILEFGDHFGGIFKDEFAKAIATNYGRKIAVILKRQAKDGAKNLIKALKKSVDKLEISIKSIAGHSEKKIQLDDDLEQLTKQLWIFLDLKPGDVAIEQPALPELPEQQIEVKCRTTRRPLSDLFVNFYHVIDGVYANLYAYITGLFLNGWEKSRPYYKVFVAQFRNEILNGPVLDAYRLAVDKVYRQSEVIQTHVKKGTWEYFKDAGDRIIKVSDDYRKSENDEICI